MRHFFKRIIPEEVKRKYRAYKKRQYEKKIVGSNVFCPICKSSFKFFASGGMDNRLNSRCYKCNSLERHRLLYLYMNEKLNFFNTNKNFKLLHFAPEKFFYDAFLDMPSIDYIPCDLFPEMYNYKGSKKILKVDMTNINYPDNTFDFILHNQVLEHIVDDKLAMQELYRVMKKGGSGIFQVPIDYNRAKTYEDFSITTPEGRKEAFGQHDHVRWYGRDYKQRLESVGFIVEVDDFVTKYSEEELAKYGLTPNEMIYYCEKLTR